MRKKILLSMMIGLLLLLTACGSGKDTSVQGSEKDHSTPANQEVSVEADDQRETETIEEDLSDETADADIPMSITLGQDIAGNDIIRIVITLPNKADYSMNCLSDCSEKVTQDGQALEMITSEKDISSDFTTVNGKDTWHTFTDIIQPGETLDVYMYYRLANTTSPVIIELNDYASNIDYVKPLPLP